MCNHADREGAMVVLARDESGRPAVWCDPCLATLVSALNAAGISTTWSCCGHGERPGAIGLADGRQLVVVPDLEMLHELNRLFDEQERAKPEEQP